MSSSSAPSTCLASSVSEKIFCSETLPCGTFLIGGEGRICATNSFHFADLSALRCIYVREANLGASCSRIIVQSDSVLFSYVWTFWSDLHVVLFIATMDGHGSPSAARELQFSPAAECAVHGEGECHPFLHVTALSRQMFIAFSTGEVCSILLNELSNEWQLEQACNCSFYTPLKGELRAILAVGDGLDPEVSANAIVARSAAGQLFMLPLDPGCARFDERVWIPVAVPEYITAMEYLSTLHVLIWGSADGSLSAVSTRLAALWLENLEEKKELNPVLESESYTRRDEMCATAVRILQKTGSSSHSSRTSSVVLVSGDCYPQGGRIAIRVTARSSIPLKISLEKTGEVIFPVEASVVVPPKKRVERYDVLVSDAKGHAQLCHFSTDDFSQIFGQPTASKNGSLVSRPDASLTDFVDRDAVRSSPGIVQSAHELETRRLYRLLHMEEDAALQRSKRTQLLTSDHASTLDNWRALQLAAQKLGSEWSSVMVSPAASSSSPTTRARTRSEESNGFSKNNNSNTEEDVRSLLKLVDYFAEQLAVEKRYNALMLSSFEVREEIIQREQSERFRIRERFLRTMY